MHTARPAWRAGRLSRSASETVNTVSSPSAWHARMMREAISPRLAIMTRDSFIVVSDCRRTNSEQRLTDLDRFGIFDADFRDDPFGAGLNGVEDFHHLDQADCSALMHFAAKGYERGRSRIGFRIEQAHDRRWHIDRAGGAARRLPCGRARGCVRYGRNRRR